jgi:hypothetical protein
MAKDRRDIFQTEPTEGNKRSLERAYRHIQRLRKIRQQWRKNSTAVFKTRRRRYIVLEELERKL